MSKKHDLELLIHIYGQEEEKLKKLSTNELKILIKEKQKQKISNSKNPNSFFILNSLPAPKTYKTKTTKKAGILVLLIFILALCAFGAMMFWYAFR